MERFYTCIFWWIFFCLLIFIFFFMLSALCLCVCLFVFFCSIRREISNSYSFFFALFFLTAFFTFTLRIDIAEFSSFLRVILFVFFSYLFCLLCFPYLAADMRCIADLYSFFLLFLRLLPSNKLSTVLFLFSKCVRLFFLVIR